MQTSRIGLTEFRRIASKPVVEDTLNDSSLLLVSGSKTSQSKDSVKKLAHAIGKVFGKHGVVRLRCVGAPAVNTAEKAFVIAKNDLARDGKVIVCSGDFVTVSFGGAEKTGLVKTISTPKFFATTVLENEK